MINSANIDSVAMSLYDIMEAIIEEVETGMAGITTTPGKEGVRVCVWQCLYRRLCMCYCEWVVWYILPKV